MAFFSFLSKKKARTISLEELEKLLTHTNKWKYQGIRHQLLDVDFGEAFLEGISLDKTKPVTLKDLKIWGKKLHLENKVYSKPEIEALGKQTGFNAWEAFEWEKEQLETIKNIRSLSLPV